MLHLSVFSTFLSVCLRLSFSFLLPLSLKRYLIHCLSLFLSPFLRTHSSFLSSSFFHYFLSPTSFPIFFAIFLSLHLQTHVSVQVRVCVHFQNTALSAVTKQHVYTCCMLSVLLYGAECWTLVQEDPCCLDAFHNCCVRVILGMSKSQQWED